MRIVIAPFAAKRRDGQPNAKNPSIRWWQTVVRKLNEHGYDVIQIAGLGEERITGVAQFIVNWPLDKLKPLINECDVWLSVDSFLPHLCWESNLKSGVVIFSVSDPVIFGHEGNTNVLKSRKYLRELQFQDWLSQDWNEDTFVTPDQVIEAVLNHVNSQGVRPADRRKFVPRSVQLANEAEVASST